jgi:D-inositol-3-phosphate glycosyltransferase
MSHETQEEFEHLEGAAEQSVPQEGAEKKKIKILFYGDSPTGTTGFATVSKNILKRLQATGMYDIHVLGINYFGEPHDLPYKIYPAIYNEQNDVYGRQKLVDFLRNKKYGWDVLFTLQDTFIMATIGEAIAKLRDGYDEVVEVKEGGAVIQKKIRREGVKFKWVYYFPIDARPKREWIEKSVKLCDVAIPYTNYAKEECERFVKREYHVIYHGFDKDTFYPMSEEEKQAFRDKYFKEHNFKERFVIVNVNRNQERKGYLQTLIAFRLLNNILPNAILYTHCDVAGDRGGNLIEVARQVGLKDNWVYPDPRMYAEGHIPDSDFINGILNIADVNISTTLGEGFGLSLIEAMATKTLNVFPDNTAIKELLADNRGILVRSGDTPNNLEMNGPLDNNILRPVTNVEDMVNKLLWVYRSKHVADGIVEKSYQWAKENCDWDKLAMKFHELIVKK